MDHHTFAELTNQLGHAFADKRVVFDEQDVEHSNLFASGTPGNGPPDRILSPDPLICNRYLPMTGAQSCRSAANGTIIADLNADLTETTMSDNPNDPMSFLQNLWGNNGFALPGMVAPTLDTDELEKRIRDLKTVEGWLRTNLSMLSMTIQGLEMQRTTLTAVKTMSQMYGDQQQAPAGGDASGLTQAAMWPWAMMQQMQESMQQAASQAQAAASAATAGPAATESAAQAAGRRKKTT
jgi:hypothetical protein